jgi:AraC-like DNA-binding protein
MGDVAVPTIYESSTDSVAPSDRLDFWQDGARSIGGLTHHTDDVASFEGRAKLSILDNLMVGRFSVTPNEARWTQDLIRQSPESFLRVVMQYQGVAQIEQGEARFTLSPGQWTLLNATRPHVIRSFEKIEELILIVPRNAISPRLFDATRGLTGARSASTGLSGLLFQFARSVLDEVGAGGTMVDEYLDGAGIELVKALLQDQVGGITLSTCKEIRLERIRTYIERNLSNPSLCVQSIADAMGCSKRYVHTLFAGEKSIHSLIWEGRVQKAARDLTSKDLTESSITTIALSHGFSCPAHFSRMFKTHFGTPPREYRHRALNS